MNAGRITGPLSWLLAAAYLAAGAIFVFDLAPQWLGFILVVIGTTIALASRRQARR